MAKRIARRHINRFEVENIMSQLAARRVKRAQPKTLTKEEFRAKLMGDLGIEQEEANGGRLCRQA